MKKLLSLLLVSGLAMATMQAQSLDEVLQNYYTNIGGLDNWKALRSTKTIGRASQMGMEFPFTMVMTRPNKQKLVVDIQGSQFVEAFDGQTAWTINPFMGGTEPQKKSTEESTEAGKQMFEDDLMDFARKGHKASLEGTEEVEGVKALVIKLTTKDGDDRFYYFDPESYVPIMIKTFAAAGQMKGMPVEQYLSDYDEVDGMMMPHSMTTKVNGQVVAQLTFDKIETNVEVDDSQFAFPGDK